jgi:hypothetical protein
VRFETVVVNQFIAQNELRVLVTGRPPGTSIEQRKQHRHHGLFQELFNVCNPLHNVPLLHLDGKRHNRMDTAAATLSKQMAKYKKSLTDAQEAYEDMCNTLTAAWRLVV